MTEISSTNAGRIDVHHHFLPPRFVEHLEKRGHSWTGGVGVPEWSAAIARETMDRHGIAAAVASVVPSPYWGDVKEAAAWATHCNEYAARLVCDDRSRFGAFATLPLPDTAAACKELEYGLDTLGLDGVILWASQGSQYLGDPAYEELFQELDRRAAIVFIHPNTTPPGSDAPKLSLPYGLVEFVMDTTRAVTNLLYSGVFERYPRIRFIISHAGGTIPYIAWRLKLGEMSPVLRQRVPKGALHYLQQLYYDTALSSSEYAFAALREFAQPTHVLFGSDFPMAPEPILQAEVAGLETSRIFDEGARKAISRDNALRLFPRFRPEAASATGREAAPTRVSTQIQERV